MRKASRAAALLTLCATAAAALTGCGGPARDGYLAVGAAAPGPERSPGENVAPQGRVEFQPLGGAPATGSSSASTSTSATPPGSQPPSSSAQGGATSTAPGGSAAPPAAAPGAGPTTRPPGTPTAPTGPGTGPSQPGTTPPATPAKLTLSTPTRAPAADRWCEQVTVAFTNTGTTAARSGTVGFATHIIGALGIDWATITTTQPLPGPIAGGATKTQTYTVCVESWRVPLGMHVETQKVTATWS
ncbi:hypothetical protein [Streptomyces sp. NPDC048340]|uniref:hypothetical protein n=1 Tax=Streptomyces sp. NPDC048340 TaxID=3365537 RepID=UPI0037196CFA